MPNVDRQIRNNTSVSNTSMCYVNVGNKCVLVTWDNTLWRRQWRYMPLSISRIIGSLKGLDGLYVKFEWILVWFVIFMINIFMGSYGFKVVNVRCECISTGYGHDHYIKYEIAI